MKSRRIRSLLKFADNVDIVDEDEDINRSSPSSRNSPSSPSSPSSRSNINKKKRNTSKKTIKTKKTRRVNKGIEKNKGVEKNKGQENIVQDTEKDIEKHPDGFVKLKCSPKHQDNDFTCYSNESLFKLKSLWNARHPDVMITSNEPREIWESLKQRLKNVCNKESCWLKQNFASSGLDKEMLMYTFAPKSPDDWKKNPNEWLNSIDIENVMKQYEKEYPYFDFIGAAPIDFDSPKMYGECVWEELCHFDLRNLSRNGKNKIGFVFNTDPHYLSGSHWISMFVSLKQNNRYIFFFDSTGTPPPKEVKRLIEKIKQQGKTMGMTFKYIENKKHHQKKPTECGMYALFMIVNLLRETMKPEDFIEDIFPDEQMEKFRKLYFNQDL